MIKPNVRVDHRRLCRDGAPKRCPGTAGIAIDQHANHLLDITFRPCQPVGEGEEVGAKILGFPGNVLKNLGETTQKAHLLRPRTRPPCALRFETLEKRERGAFLAIHFQTTAAR